MVPHGCDRTACWHKRTLLPPRQRLPGEREEGKAAATHSQRHQTGRARSTHCNQESGTSTEGGPGAHSSYCAVTRRTL